MIIALELARITPGNLWKAQLRFRQESCSSRDVGRQRGGEIVGVVDAVNGCGGEGGLGVGHLRHGGGRERVQRRGEGIGRRVCLRAARAEARQRTDTQRRQRTSDGSSSHDSSATELQSSSAAARPLAAHRPEARRERPGHMRPPKPREQRKVLAGSLGHLQRCDRVVCRHPVEEALVPARTIILEPLCARHGDSALGSLIISRISLR